MKNPNEKYTTFVKAVEESSRKKLRFSTETALLLEIAATQNLSAAFEEAMFDAKFLTKTRNVMQRIGPGGEGYDKLASEFQSSVEKCSALLRSIAEHGSHDFGQEFVDTFLVIDQGGLENLLGLCADLSSIKNWQVDGKVMPFGTSTESEIGRAHV
jgi:hypothetical protein